MALIALCDCDNFFVSCERIARPDLASTPAVVLSSNDGCIVARSSEVKAMGIKMGEPYFRVRALLAHKGVHVFSGNLPYYRSVSRKVMAVLSRYSDRVEQYSIDEAFLNFDIKSISDHDAYAREIRDAVRALVGVPISIGVAPTKTLAKLASKAAKRGDGVHVMTDESREALLASAEIGDVWGIGRRGEEFLRRWGVNTAADLVRKDPLWVRSKMKVHGSITQLELMGTSCIPIDTTEKPPKSIQSSHAFGEPIKCFADLSCAVMEHAIKAGRTMRGHRLAAKAISVFLLDGYISREHRFVSVGGRFERPICDDETLVRASARLLKKLFVEGRFYTRAGLSLTELSDARYSQRSLFDASSSKESADASARREKSERLARAIDDINAKLGKRAVYPADLAVDKKPWRGRSEQRSRPICL